MRTPRSRWVAVMWMLAVGVGLAANDNWPQFRGAGSLGVVEDPRLPDRWSTTENVAWVAEIPGQGWSSPVVWGDTIVVTSVVSDGDVEVPNGGLFFGGERSVSGDVHHWMVYGIDWETGRVRWEREVHRGVPEARHHVKNTYASETPVIDGERVYAYFGNLGVFCLDMDGRLLWSTQFEPVRTRSGWGTASSPVLHDGRLYIVNDNTDQSFIVALSAETGAEIWRTARDERSSNWSTPYVWENELRTEIVTTGSGKVRAYGLDGHLLWELTGMSSITVPTPFSKFGLLFLSSGYIADPRRPVFAIRPGASGDITLAEGEQSNDYIAWFHPQAASYNTSPIIYGDAYYTLFDRGFFTSHDAKTGQEIYGKQRIQVGVGFTSSPWAYNGRIFALSEDGDTYVIAAGPEFTVVGKNSLDEFTMATPAIARGSLIIRTVSKLYRITEGAGR